MTVIGEADAFDAGTTLTGGTGTDTLQISQKATSGNATAKIDGDITGFDKIVVTDTAGNNTGGLTIDIKDAAYATALDIDTTALDAGESDTIQADNATK